MQWKTAKNGVVERTAINLYISRPHENKLKIASHHARQYMIDILNNSVSAMYL